MTVGDCLIIHVNPLGNLANRMLQYMAALALKEFCPRAALSNIRLPEWRIHTEEIPIPCDSRIKTIERRKTSQFDLKSIGKDFQEGKIDAVIIDDYLQDVRFFSAPESHRNLFFQRKKRCMSFQYLQMTSWF